MSANLTRCRALVALAAVLAFASTSHAQSDDVRQTVLRVASFSGEVSYCRGDDPDDWQPASLNFPMTLGDRLYTEKGSRAELQTEGGSVYLAPETDFAVLNLTLDVEQLSLGIGSASFHVGRVDGETFEVDTPNAAVTFDRPGDFRIDVDRDGNTRVLVTRGHAIVSSGGGEVPLEAGSLMAVEGIDSPSYDVMSLPRPDSWDQWVATRERRSYGSQARYVSADISGAEDLDEYGGWSNVSGYGTCWSPAHVSADWQPYRAGRWAWQDPWGWSWISNEPWGWAPYHYGRWVNASSRWYWVPEGPEVRSVRYAPALVVFVGGSGGGNVGWFPLAPHDPFAPWWGSGARTANVTYVTYVNRSHVTVVARSTFVSGAPVGTNVIRDARAVREISTAPVVRGPIAVVPVAASIRVSTGGAGSVTRPPAAIQSRAVVTRLAPPPAPAPFREKANVIRENHGAPVAPAQAARLAPEAKAIRPTRPVAAEGGRVTLAPKNAPGAARPVPATREVPPGQARHEAPQPAAAPPAADAGRQQQAESARRQQQDTDAKAQKQQQQQAADTRKQQQDADARAQKRQQDADAGRKQQAEDATRQRQEIEARTQHPTVDPRKQPPPQAESPRKEQPPARDRKAADRQRAAEDQKKEKSRDKAPAEDEKH